MAESKTEHCAVPEPFEWDESFDVKVEEFNTQHKKLFKLINALAADKGNAEVLKELLEYVVMHFKSEEDKFEEKSYAGAEGHKAIHDKFVADASAVTEVTDDVIAFLKQWLVDHIKLSDMKYSNKLA